MAKEKKTKTPSEDAPETPVEETVVDLEEAGEPEVPAEPAPEAELEALKGTLAQREDDFLRLRAEYDNYRRRTDKEKEDTWTRAAGETAKAFLPVYDNLERALKQETADAAYRKGVEMTMTQLKEVLAGLGITEIPALGEPFDVNLHAAVMHVDDPELGENTVKEVFQTGFKLGETVIRYAMVVVAN